LGHDRNHGEREGDEARSYRPPEHVILPSKAVLWSAWKHLEGNAHKAAYRSRRVKVRRSEKAHCGTVFG
jgi:hypothetical protein